MKSTLKPLMLTALTAAISANAYAQFDAPREKYVQYLVTTNHPDRTYKTGEKPEIKIEAYKGGIPLDGEKVYFSSGAEMMLPLPNDSVAFKDGIARIKLAPAKAPGFIECDLQFSVDGETYKNVVKVGVEPEKIRTLTSMPEDFREFWAAQLDRAGKTDLNPKLQYMPQYSDNDIDVYLAELTVGENGKTFCGYLSKPKGGGKHPVMFSPPGAGPYKRWPQTEFAKKGFIVLNVDIHGLSPECSKELNDARFHDIYGYWGRGISDRDSCYFRQVYAGCSRCIDYLCNLPEWDGENVVTMDGSQGGALSIITAALNPKVTAVCAYYPALCDLTGFHHGRAGGWPKYFRDSKVENDATQQVLATLPYYDVVNFARILEAPGYYAFGFNDDTCSPTSIYSMLNEMKAPKTIALTYTNSHFNFHETTVKASDWVMGQIK